MINLLDNIGVGTANDGERMEILDANGKSFSDVVSEQPFLDEFSYEVAELFEGLGNYISEDNESIKDDEEYEDSLEDATKRTNRLLAACVIDFGNINDKNITLAYSEENVLFLLDNSPMLADALNVFIAKRANFLKKP